MTAGHWRAAAAVLALAGVAFGGSWLAEADEPTTPPLGSSGDMPSLMAAGSHADRPEPDPAAPMPDADWQRAERAVFRDGSLRGTDLPAWGVARGEALVPNRLLRDRFDHYLLAASELGRPALDALVAAHARRDLGEPLAAEVLALWERYLRLQHHAFQQVARPGDLASMTTALQEHRQVRQTLLGVHWAQAFYGEEEARLAAEIERARAGSPPPQDPVAALLEPPPGTSPAELHRRRVDAFGPERARALQRIDEEDAAWQQRIAAARAEVQAVLANPALSGPQREASLAELINTRFPAPSEQLRALGLLGL